MAGFECYHCRQWIEKGEPHDCWTTTEAALTQDLSVYVFLGRAVAAPQVRRIHQSSRAKVGHLIHVRHRDEVEPPITDWLLEAYTQSDELTTRARSAGAATRARARAKPRSKREPAGKAARRETTAGTGTSRRG